MIINFLLAHKENDIFCVFVGGRLDTHIAYFSLCGREPNKRYNKHCKKFLYKPFLPNSSNFLLKIISIIVFIILLGILKSTKKEFSFLPNSSNFFAKPPDTLHLSPKLALLLVFTPPRRFESLYL